MNFPVVCRALGTVCRLIAAMMGFSLLFGFPMFHPGDHIEWRALGSIAGAIACSLIVGQVFVWAGRRAGGHMFRKEAMAVVGLSWALATVLGALPYAFNGTERKAGDPMTPADWLFESQSGFSTTGATVLEDLDNRRGDPNLPHCILFWRSSTHFLGGLGIIVLFVAVLGQGSAGKALMRAEMPGPSKEGSQARMQHTALSFAKIYCLLNVVLTLILMFQGLSLFDALCHAFGTMATGGFSTHDESVGFFQRSQGYNGAAIEMTLLVFMVLAGTNFTLLYFLAVWQPKRLLADVEWRTYISIIAAATVLAMIVGLVYGHFFGLWDAFRYASFQVVAIVTTTGFATHDFDNWGHFARAILLVLMFVGGCAGSTGGGLKVIRHVLFFKTLRLEVEQAYRPSVVRPLRVGGEPVEDQDLRKNIMVFFSLALVIFILSWLALICIEPDSTWYDDRAGKIEQRDHNKLIDSASAVAATLNNIGPGLGAVGPKQNYARFSDPSKLLFIFLMMVGRLEIFPILVLFRLGFWRSR